MSGLEWERGTMDGAPFYKTTDERYYLFGAKGGRTWELVVYENGGMECMRVGLTVAEGKRIAERDAAEIAAKTNV